MGRLVADADKRDWDELTAEYGAQLMEGLIEDYRGLGPVSVLPEYQRQGIGKALILSLFTKDSKQMAKKRVQATLCSAPEPRRYVQ